MKQCFEFLQCLCVCVKQATNFMSKHRQAARYNARLAVHFLHQEMGFGACEPELLGLEYGRILGFMKTVYHSHYK